MLPRAKHIASLCHQMPSHMQELAREIWVDEEKFL
jgi:hypothetical protein